VKVFQAPHAFVFFVFFVVQSLFFLFFFFLMFEAVARCVA